MPLVLGLLITMGLVFLFHWGIASIDPGWSATLGPDGDLAWEESARFYWYVAMMFRGSIFILGIRAWKKGLGKLAIAIGLLGLVVGVISYPRSPERFIVNREGIEHHGPGQESRKIAWADVRSASVLRRDRVETSRSQRRRWRVFKRKFFVMEIGVWSNKDSFKIPVREIEDLHAFFRFVRPNYGYDADASYRTLMMRIEERIPKTAKLSEDWPDMRRSPPNPY